MSTQNVMYLTSRAEWRTWLEKNFRKESEAWLIYPKKSTGKDRIPYNDAVEEALCFGWIDSINKAYDEDHTIQRFTPRNPKSSYSQPNKERLQWLAERDLVHPDLIGQVNEVISEVFIFPKDILDAIKKDKAVWGNYKQFSEPYKRIRIAYIDAARKRPEEFEKRLKNFIEKTLEGKMIKGFGGIEKYY